MALDRPFSSVTLVEVGGLCCLSGPPQSVQSWGLSLLGLEVLGQHLTPSTEAPTLWDPRVGPQGTLGLKGSSGVWGVYVVGGTTAQGEAWQVDGQNAGVQGNPLGQYTQGALHSARKQPAFQELLWGGEQGGLWGGQASPGLGPHFKCLSWWGVGLGVCRQ